VKSVEDSEFIYYTDESNTTYGLVQLLTFTTVVPHYVEIDPHN